MLGLYALQTDVPLFAPPASDKSWAVVVGVSRYQNLDKDLWLDDADADADSFSQFITSAQGLSFRPDHVFTITNEQATERAIISLVSTKLVKKVERGDSVYI